MGTCTPVAIAADDRHNYQCVQHASHHLLDNLASSASGASLFDLNTWHSTFKAINKFLGNSSGSDGNEDIRKKHEKESNMPQQGPNNSLLLLGLFVNFPPFTDSNLNYLISKIPNRGRLLQAVITLRVRYVFISIFIY